MEQLIFYFFAILLVFAAGMVITVKNPVHAALFLVLAFFSSAAIWLLLEAEFLAIALVLVYVGAVMVLFLFVVMMLDVNQAELRAGFTKYLPVGGLVALLMMVAMSWVVGSRYFNREVNPHPADYSNTLELGKVLYTDYIYPFEIAAIILLVAIVAAIALTLRRRKDSKYIDAATQINIRREDRVRIVSMPPETR